MKLSRCCIVAGKELTDGFRDRRSLYSILVGALIGPVIIAFLLNVIAGQERSAQEIRVPVVGRENAPVLVDWLRQQAGVEVVQGPADPENAVRSRSAEFVVIIPKEFPEKFRQSRPAPVQLVSDSTRQATHAKLQRLRLLLARFSGETGGLRLIARGVSPAIATAIKVEDIEVSSAQQRAAMVFGMIPMFLVLAAFAAGMQIATDSTAGERERGSLEPLLLNPIPRIELIVGKWAAAVTSSMAGMMLTLIVISGVLLSLPLEDLGFRFRFNVLDALLLLLAVLPMALIAPSLQMYFASFAKTFKEAQSYMGFLIIVPMIPGIMTAFYPLSDRPWMAPIPILGQYALATDILGGDPPSAMYMLAGAVSAAVMALVFLALTTRLFSREKIIFGR